MAIFLENLDDYILYEFSEKWRTLISESETGKEQRRQKWTYPKRQVNIICTHLYGTNSNTAWNFYHARKGAYSSFVWFVPVSTLSYTGEYVGQGDGSTTTFTLPGKDISTGSLTIYVDGNAKTLNAHYTFGDGTGADGKDQITFIAGNIPASGEDITADFTGTLGLSYRFGSDKLTRPMFQKSLQEWGLELVEDKLA